MCYRAATRGNLVERILQTNFFSINQNKVVSPLSSERKGWENPHLLGSPMAFIQNKFRFCVFFNFKKEWFLFLIIEIHLSVVPTIIYFVLIVSRYKVRCTDNDKIEIIRLLLESKRNSK
jgi:hypothetical protein